MIRSGWYCHLTLGALAVTMLAGCPSEDSSGGDLPPPAAGTVSFANDVIPIFTARCTTCHRSGGSATTAGVPLWLTAADAYGQLVGQPSSQDSNLVLVVPGDPEASYLYEKVAQDQPAFGARMPLFGGELSASDQAVIRDWIA